MNWNFILPEISMDKDAVRERQWLIFFVDQAADSVNNPLQNSF